MCPLPRTHAPGFTLVEAVLATGLLMTLLVGLAPVLVWSHEAMRAVREDTAALAAAQAKLEALRSLPLTWAMDGTPLTDPALAPSPAGVLTGDVAGWVEGLDADGRVLAGMPSAPRFVRRWSVTALDAQGDALLLQVHVARVGPDGAVLPFTARLATVRTRQP